MRELDEDVGAQGEVLEDHVHRLKALAGAGDQAVGRRVSVEGVEAHGLAPPVREELRRPPGALEAPVERQEVGQVVHQDAPGAGRILRSRAGS